MSMPSGEFGQAATGPRPREVDASFWLWVASFVLGVISLLYFLTDFDTIRDTALEEARRQLHRQPGAGVTGQQLDAIATAGLVIGAVIGVALTALQLLFAFLMRAGRNWARIVLAVFGVLGVLSGLYSTSSEAGAQSVLSVVSLLVVLGALVTMFLPGANPWFRSRTGF